MGKRGTTAAVSKSTCYEGPTPYMNKCNLATVSSVFNAVIRDDGMTVYVNRTCHSLGIKSVVALCPDPFYGLAGVCMHVFNVPRNMANLLTCPKCLVDLA